MNRWHSRSRSSAGAHFLTACVSLQVLGSHPGSGGCVFPDNALCWHQQRAQVSPPPRVWDGNSVRSLPSTSVCWHTFIITIMGLEHMLNTSWNPGNAYERLALRFRANGICNQLQCWRGQTVTASLFPWYRWILIGSIFQPNPSDGLGPTSQALFHALCCRFLHLPSLGRLKSAVVATQFGSVLSLSWGCGVRSRLHSFMSHFYVSLTL